MRMSELSERSGLPVASIKYYQREALVPFGEHTSANQSQYGEAHVDRLRLVRALIEVGGLSVSSAMEIVTFFIEILTRTQSSCFRVIENYC